MSIFEVAMMLCFGFAWPFSIYKSWRSRSTKGKSVAFLYVVLAGYVAGIVHKVLNSFDAAIVFYIINFLLVSADIVLFHRNRSLEKSGR